MDACRFNPNRIFSFVIGQTKSKGSLLKIFYQLDHVKYNQSAIRYNKLRVYIKKKNKKKKLKILKCHWFLNMFNLKL